jgi:hypothetical protein
LASNYTSNQTSKCINIYFGPVAQQLNEFVMPNIMKKQEEQMELSLYYHAVEIELEVLHSKEMVRFTLLILA